ncbi:MAG: hypothetical protein IJE65_00785 [Clostridia bacterium]|nr:hypothetical protein [Clostridia bacterium]
MKQIKVTDMTLEMGAATLSFKEKIEIARQLDNLKVDVIDMPEIVNVTTDSLLIRTICAFAKNSTISVSTGRTVDGVAVAAAAVAGAKSTRLKVNLPVSPVQMEYSCHKKPAKMLELAKRLFTAATEKSNDVEFFAADATRAEPDFLKEIITLAIDSGIKTITLCDDEDVMLPDEFATFISDVKENNPALNDINFGVLCRNRNSMATASAIMAIKVGVDEIKCCAARDDLPKLNVLANIINNSGDRIGVKSNLNYNELYRILKQIEWICGTKMNNDIENIVTDFADSDQPMLASDDTLETVSAAVKKLGYDLSEEDYVKVYDEFKRLAERKKVGSKELDAIVASTALQVPPTYKLVSYVINTGNIVSASAQITLEKSGEEISSISMGDGPVDASFKAIEQIIGCHFELDDFQIQSVTEGREAVGSAIVRLRHNGKLFSGNGISTDIIGSSIRAYINAVNKIVHEES